MPSHSFAVTIFSIQLSLTFLKLIRHLRKLIQNMMGRLTRKNGETLSCSTLPFLKIWLFSIWSEFLLVTNRIKSCYFIFARLHVNLL